MRDGTAHAPAHARRSTRPVVTRRANRPRHATTVTEDRPTYALASGRANRPRHATIAREDRPGYDAPIDAPIATLVGEDRDDVLRNLQDAEEALREVMPELVLRLAKEAGDEFLIQAVATAMGRLSSALRTLEERVASGPQ